MSNSPLSPSPAGFPPATLTPCPTPPSSVFSRLSPPKTVAKQLEEAAVAALPPNPTIEDLPKITWKNRRFVQEDSLARKGAKDRKSQIRSHGTFLVELNYQDQPIELSVGFVIDSDVPFTIFEHSFLRKIFNHFDSDLVVQMALSGSSVTREIHRLFEAKRDTIKAELCNALTAVHISFDLWTSPNRFAIMAVFAHFIDQLGHQQSRLLALRRQSGAHSGENLAGSSVAEERMTYWQNALLLLARETSRTHTRPSWKR
ncbi:hypothetical protein FSARC_12207 [Fusarium sarcochroum]|uniref:Transposase n=1 Tax=Fusarium sarcochroum TaxID=1208366 RepID=A0A8H4TAB1_9HYPO|nr:hypothetical protein FSARC_12207 [Fusarium sarcochroum]